MKGGESPEVAPPAAKVDDIDMHSITIVVKMWVKSENYWDIYYNFKQNAYTTLLAKGFKIATPKVNIEQ